jgi:AcrR family transcriptional regulator
MTGRGAKREAAGRKRQAAPAPAALETKLTPSQDRARSTFESILSATGELLAEVGFERLSTNMICERAGLTPPALYRYFPNKYAVLKELAVRLMERQDEAVFEWIESGGAESATLEEAIAKTRAIQERVVQITREEPGGLWTMRAIRAVPMLRDVRLASRDKVADQLFARMRVQYPDSRLGQLRIATRLSTELMYAATEMVIEEPDRDVESITSEVSAMVAGYYRALAAPS